MALVSYKQDFLNACSSAGALNFGSFVLKSKRVSPYFVNAGLVHRFDLTNVFADAFAHTLGGAEDGQLAFDVLFGPAYKGIVLAATTGGALSRLDPARFGALSWSYNRKEAKDHGEGGSIVGAGLKGKRVVIIDDVITAGTAIREAVELIRREGGTLVGIVVAIDRQEKVTGSPDDDPAPRPSAIGQLRKELAIPVLTIVNLDDITEYVKKIGSEDQLRQMEAYRAKYRASD